jgi:hypothetical protein
MTEKTATQDQLSDKQADAQFADGLESLLQQSELDRKKAKKAAIVLTASIAESALQTWLTKKLWNWFVPGRKLSGAQAFGLGLVFDVHRAHLMNDAVDKMKNPVEDSRTYVKMGYRAGFYATVLLIAGITKRFVRK